LKDYGDLITVFTFQLLKIFMLRAQKEVSACVLYLGSNLLSN
jgi:hypothetical protein